MRYLVDTNVLLRWSHADSPDHAMCTKTVDGLLKAGHDPCVCAQVLIEFWAVATRPRAVNGLGLAPAEVRGQMANLREMFTCFPEPFDMADRWQVVAESYSVLGKQSHDARIAALMLAHGVTRILTLNTSDFTRYQGIVAISPSEVPGIRRHSHPRFSRL